MRKAQVDRQTGSDLGLCRERVTRIELAFSAWEADVLPLNYTRGVCRGVILGGPAGPVAGVCGPYSRGVPAPVELVIFDCDGVLVDSERLAIDVDVVVMAELGWPLTREEVVELFLGRSHADVTAMIEEHLVMKLPPDWGLEFRPLYDEAFRALRAVAGIEEALDRITVPICVASSGSHRKIRRSLEQVGLYHRFVGRIFSASDVARGNPAPDLFLDAAETLQVSPEACLVVEDSPFGIEAARAAGMRALAYAGGGLTSVRELEGPGTVVFHDMADLPYLISVAGGEIEA